MEAILEDLTGTISKEIEAFNELLETLHAKQRAIVEGQVERLNESVLSESKLVRTTRSLQAERAEHTKELAAKLSLDKANPKLSEIIAEVEGKYAGRLTEQRELLISLAQKIQTLNASNQFLLDYSLKFIEKNLELLLGCNDKTNVYQKDGKVKKSMTKVLDQSV